MKNKLFTIFLTLALVLNIAFGVVPSPKDVFAGISKGKITFTFDDGESGIYNYAPPILASIPGVAYIATNDIDKLGFMTWAQVKELEDKYGWEIGSHTVTHPLLTEIDNEQLENELKNSKSILESQGLNIQTFATPYGDYNNNVLAHIAKYYSSHRGFWDRSDNIFPYNDYLLQVKSVEARTSVSRVKQWIDQAIAGDKWLILVFHNIVASGARDYDYNAYNLQKIVDYVIFKKVPTVTVTEGFTIAGQNLVQNPSFEQLNDSWVSYWTTDSPEGVTVDANSQGSFPYPLHTIKMIGASNSRHLFSDFISIDNQKKYIWKTYLNLQNYSKGELGFYIDEYDSQGNWISGRWLGCTKSNFVGIKSYQYLPTSSNVSKIGLQIYVTANSNFTTHLDSFELKSL